MAQSPLAISRMQKVPLREVWMHEAHNLTRWLAENLDLVADCIGTPLAFVQREANVGPFYADIVAEDGAGRTVLIENQLEATDHDHLGKLITYMSNLDAKTAIWITPNPRFEHERAIQWLNEFLPVDVHFYLIRIEAYRIDNSPAAPLLTIVAGPSDISAAIGEQKKATAARHDGRLQFWAQLLEKANLRTQLHARLSPTTENWLSAGSGISGLQYTYNIKANSWSVSFIIDTGDGVRNKRIFDDMQVRKHDIEERFGEPLSWSRLDDKKSSYIGVEKAGGRVGEAAHVEKVQDAMIEAMLRLERAFKPEVDRLRTIKL